jgi:hypothetical protein
MESVELVVTCCLQTSSLSAGSGNHIEFAEPADAGTSTKDVDSFRTISKPLTFKDIWRTTGRKAIV